VFVIALVFQYFGVPLSQQHRVLFWGILGVLIMRGLMIGAGAVLIQRFDWIMYVFGALLLLTAAKLHFSKDEAVDPRATSSCASSAALSGHDGFRGSHFFVRENGKRAMTPLFLALVVVETTTSCSPWTRSPRCSA
jgi:tellurite resistance protein TerC